MYTVSGIATASGVSPLLNAPRDVSNEVRATAGEAARADVVRRKDEDQRLVTRRETARAIAGPETAERPAPTPERLPAERATDADRRREKFVEAVGALRRDASQDPIEITSDRLRDLREIAERPNVVIKAEPGDRPAPNPPERRAGPVDRDQLAVTFIDDGIPQPVEPVTTYAPPPPPEDDAPSLVDDGVPAELEPIVSEEPEEPAAPSLTEDGIPGDVEPFAGAEDEATGAEAETEAA